MMDTYNSWKFNFILLFALKGNISKIVKCFHAKGDFNLNFALVIVESVDVNLKWISLCLLCLWIHYETRTINTAVQQE